MTRLLRAGFRRMLRGKIFWICMALLFANALFRGFADFLFFGAAFMRSEIPLEPMLFGSGSDLAFFLAVFTGIFLDPEHSEGGFRNKLVVGHTRGALYLSNLILCMTAGAMMFAANALVLLPVGFARGFSLRETGEEIGLRTAVMLLALFALTAIFVLIGMLIRSRGLVLAIGLCLAMTIASASIHGWLEFSEYIETRTVVGIGGDGEPRFETIREKNPAYIGGTPRRVLETLNDLLPTSQLIRLEAGELPADATLPGYSAGIFLLATASGATAFRKRDLK